MTQEFVQKGYDASETCYFIYNKNGERKAYAIKIDFFKALSKKFSNNKVLINSDKTINLFDESEENLNISDESIQTFINYVHCQENYNINNNNVIEIKYLAEKYEVRSLIEKTEEYINKHQQELILPHLSCQFDYFLDASPYENAIAEHLEEYIKYEALTELNISNLYRILEKYATKNEMNNEIIKFLFKCLSKQGRKASVLFSFVDKKINLEHLNKLINEYSNIFDFHFLDSSLLAKSLYELHNSILFIEKQFHLKQEETMNIIRDEINQLKNEITNMKKMNKKLHNEQNSKEELHKKEIEAINNDHKNDLENLKKSHQDEIENLKKSHQNEIENLKKSHQNEIENLKKSHQNEYKQINDNIKNSNNEIKEINIKISNSNKEHESQINEIKSKIDNYNKKYETQINSQLQQIQQIQKQIPNITPKSLISQANDNQIFTIPYLDWTIIDESHDTERYFKNLIIWICKDKPKVKFGTWIGAVAPNCRGWMILTIYNTSDINKEGLPRYCGGCYQKCSNTLVTFSTHDYAYSLKSHT